MPPDSPSPNANLEAPPPARHGLVIGKFMPLHAGHQYLIATARQQVDTLTIVLFSKPHEPISGYLREDWLIETYPDLPIFQHDLDGPVDFTSETAWQFWVDAIRSMLRAPVDLVFTSEPYGDELARRLGARHISVDPSRQRFPISATAIRAAPLAHWEYLPPAVRAHYVRRVAIVGAESTGKTTLAHALAAHFNTVWVPEFARDYLIARGGVCTEADMPLIADGQAAAEDAHARQANRLLICDTNLLTTRLWHEHYFGAPPARLALLAAERTAHLTLLCAPDNPWVADGLRDSPGHRAWFHDRFQAELDAAGLPYRILSGPYPARLQAAIEAVTRLLATPA